MFLHALTRAVSNRTRSKGLAYFLSGAVIDLSGDASSVQATVRGTRDYRVRVTRQGSRFIASCQCPYFEDRAEICKHVWALLEAADRRNLLGQDDPPGRATLVPDAGLPSGSRAPARSGPDPVPAWERFLADLRVAVGTKDRVARLPRFVDQQILYVLDEPSSGDAAVLRLMSRRRKRSGDWTKPKPVAVAADEIADLPEPEDREILSLVVGAADEWASSGYYSASYPGRAVFRPVGPIATRVLPLAARTGRAFVTPQADAALEPVVWDEGPAWRFELRVDVTDRDGARAITIDGDFVRGDERMPLAEPVLVLRDGFLVARGRLSPLEAVDSFVWLSHLRLSGALTLPSDAAAPLVETLATTGVSPDRLPDSLRYDVVNAVPRPCVRVSRTPPAAFFHAREYLQALVQFDYEGTLVDGQPGSIAYDPDRRRMVRRDVAVEARAAARLQQLGFHHLFDHRLARQVLVVGVELFPRAIRTLVNEGWRVEAEGRVFRAAGGLDMHVASGLDWFELHGRVDFGDGQSLGIPELLAAIQRGDGSVVLDDGTRGVVPEEWLRQYAGMARFGEPFGDHIRFRRSQTALLDAMLAAQPAVSVDEAFTRARAALATFNGIGPIDPPASFMGTLRPYQREALGWFDFLRRFGFGGCLADDMGLGKTVMVLALLLQRVDGPAENSDGGDRRPSLAVVPRSLVFNWLAEARRFAPSLRVIDYTGTARSLDDPIRADLVVTTYGTLRRDAAFLGGIRFDYVILDEAQAIKNASTASARAVRLLDARHRLALSGTPLENHVGELWSLFEFLNPGLLGSAAGFELATAGRSRMQREELALVAKAVRPFILRRTKEQVAPELPDRSEQTLYCELEGAQRRLYDQLRSHYRRSLLAQVARSGLNRSKIQVLEALLRLRQAACHAGLVDEAHAGDPSAKLELLLPRLAELVEEGHKALVFSQFTSFLSILRTHLEAQGLAFEYLDGRTRDRASRVERFQSDPGCRLFLISLKAGGLGLNLTGADYVFLLDPWWNPASEAQAIDRAHRIGQTRHVLAYRLIARDTVEEKVAELQQSKRELAEAILSENASLIRDLQPEDLEWLLS
jgi:superfamily II DNA or RNA helicase